MIKCKILILFLLFFFNFSFSQTLVGKVKSEATEVISANILIKNSENKQLISEFFKVDEFGNFNIVLKQNYSKVYFEVTAIGYHKISDSIVNPKKNNTYLFNFNLISKTNKLEEIVIKQEKFKIEGDTISFNPRAYRDGTERKAEDLIKKIPGMEVDGNGTIKFRGKKVSSVQLEGDDLFGYNYATGTRNISVDMIEQIQTINNYSENPLLKGIENSDNVAINLKLKKGKVDVSGNGNISSGLYSTIRSLNAINLNLIGISKKYKSFGTINSNNIGMNNSSKDYFAMSSNLQDIIDKEFYTTKAISENAFSNNLENQISATNNQMVFDYDIVYRFSKKLAIKTNLFFVNDKLSLTEQNNSFFTTENITYNDKTETVKSPEHKKIELKLTYNTNKLSLLEVETVFEKEKINTNKSILQDNIDFFNTTLNSENLFWKNNLKYTYKLNSKSALQFVSNYSINSIPQKLIISPNQFNFSGNLQQSEFQKKYLSNKLIFMGNINNIKYAFILGYIFDKNPFSSNLLFNNTSIQNFQNNFTYRKSTLYSEISATFGISNWRIQPTLRLNKLNQNYNSIQNQDISKNDLIAIPTINLSYGLNDRSSLKLTGNYDKTPPNEENLIQNLLTQDNRLVKRSRFDLDLLQSQNYSLSYRYNNLFSSFATNLAIIYDHKKNTYLSSVEILNNYTIYNYFQSPTNIENYLLTFSIEKYINLLKTTVKHSSNYGINNYKNIVNQSDLRNNKSTNYNAYFFIKTAFRFPINFENKFNYRVVNFYSENENTNVNISYSNNSKILIKPSKFWLFTIGYDYYLPNTKINDNFTFLDFDIKYKPKRLRWIEFWITGKNLLNNKFYSQTENSDFQITVYESSLMQKHYLITLDFKI